jgi:anti-sigma B factor antagonist
VESSPRLSISGGPAEALEIEGELDAFTAPQLEEAFRAVAGPERMVRLHLGRVTFIDSTGIRVIVRADRDLRSDGGRLVIVSPSPAVARLLEITALDEHLDVEAGTP